MKKGSPKEEQVIVEYKGTSFVLAPGHKVYELNVNTGVVREHGLERIFDIFFWRKPRFRVKYDPKLMHIPAHDLYKAKIRFKNLVKNIGIKIKE